MMRSRAFMLSAAASTLALCIAAGPAMAQKPTTVSSSNAPGGAQRTAQYATQAALTDRFEVEAARLALEKSRNNAVRRFAQQMINEHQTLLSQLATAASSQIAVPVDRIPLDPYHMQKLQQLREASGAQFDRMYVDAQVLGHREAVDLHQDYARDGSDPPLKQVATQTVPHVQQHLNQALSLQSQTAEVPAGTPQQQLEMMRPDQSNTRQDQRRGIERRPMNMPYEERRHLRDDRP